MAKLDPRKSRPDGGATGTLEPAAPTKALRRRKGLLGALFPTSSPENHLEEIAKREAEIQALRHEVASLEGRLDQYRKEQAQFDGQAPFRLGCTELLAEIIPPIPGASVRSSVGSPTMAGYLLSGDAWQILLSKYLVPDSRLLDIGCGCGKMARNLAHHPHVKKYIGFDVIKSSIDFCNELLAPRIGGKFEFHCLDVHSECYNPSGTLKSTEVVFPADDGSIDLAWGCSLFTHLLEDDAKHYLREVRRVLSPRGLFLPTIHINPAPGTRYSGNEARIDIEIDYFIELATEAGLRLDSRLGNVLGQYAMLFRLP